MGSGLDLSCLNYRKVAAFVTSANAELQRVDSPLRNHPNYEFFKNLLADASVYAGYSTIEFVQPLLSPGTEPEVLLANGIVAIPEKEVSATHTAEELATLTAFYAGSVNEFILNLDLMPPTGSYQIDQLIIDEVVVANSGSQAAGSSAVRDFQRAYAAFFIVWEVLYHASRGVASAGHIPHILGDLIQYYLVNASPLVRSNASDNAAQAVCDLKTVKYPQGTSLDKCDILLSTQDFRLLAGSLVSLVPAKRDCWKGATAPQIAYRVCRPRWCRRPRRVLPIVERCELIDAGIYYAYDCSPIFGLDKYMDAAALAGLVTKVEVEEEETEQPEETEA